MNKKFNVLLSVLFLIFIFGFGILLIALPDRDFSDNENRSLQQLPSLSVKNFFSGKFMTEIEDYVTDQFPFRDGWMQANSFVQTALLKKDINGVYLSDDGYLLEVFDGVDQTLYKRQMQALNKFVSYHEEDDVNYYIALVPNSVYILKEKLPAYAPTLDQSDYINGIYDAISGELLTKIDVCETLSDHSSEYIYYRTDHHWTSLGAYYGYTAIAKAMGLESSSLESYAVTAVTNDFKGTFFSKGNFAVIPDTIEKIELKTPVSITAWGDDGIETDTLYYEPALETKDKYTYFLGGNPAHYTIETSSDSGKTLVMIKDSYSHSLVPFFIEHYSSIHMLDLRYINKNINDYIAEIAPDDVLLVFNAATFSGDTNINKLGFAPKTTNK